MKAKETVKAGKSKTVMATKSQAELMECNLLGELLGLPQIYHLLKLHNIQKVSSQFVQVCKF